MDSARAATSRRIIPLSCGGDRLLATLDGPAGAGTGWLFVTGGTQTRVGPHRLYERLAERLAAAGQAVIRFDRRGVGDSEGDDPGYLGAADDMRAALAALRQAFPALDRVHGFGLCDGAAAITRAGLSLDGAVLANPWVIEPSDDLPPAAAIRGHYARRIADPHAWRRLIGGGVDLRRLARGLAALRRREDLSLARRFADGLPAGSLILLAEGDNTAQAFRAAWRALKGHVPPVGWREVATASHSFADPPAFEALAGALLDHAAAKSASAR